MHESKRLLLSTLSLITLLKYHPISSFMTVEQICQFAKVLIFTASNSSPENQKILTPLSNLIKNLPSAASAQVLAIKEISDIAEEILTPIDPDLIADRQHKPILTIVK